MNPTKDRGLWKPFEKIGGRMWRFLTVFFVGGLLGAGFGVALGFFLFPYRFLAAIRRYGMKHEGTAFP